MLRSDDREKRFAERIEFALQDAKSVAEDVKILRRENDEAAFRELGREIVVSRFIAFNDILRSSFQSVLANDDGTLFAGLDVFREKKNPIRAKFGKCPKADFVPFPQRFVIDEARLGI